MGELQCYTALSKASVHLQTTQESLKIAVFDNVSSFPAYAVQFPFVEHEGNGKTTCFLTSS